MSFLDEVLKLGHLLVQAGKGRIASGKYVVPIRLNGYKNLVAKIDYAVIPDISEIEYFGIQGESQDLRETLTYDEWEAVKNQIQNYTQNR